MYPQRNGREEPVGEFVCGEEKGKGDGRGKKGGEKWEEEGRRGKKREEEGREEKRGKRGKRGKREERTELKLGEHHPALFTYKHTLV